MNTSLRKQCETLNSAISKVTSLYGKWAKKHGLNYNSLMVLYTMEDAECRTQKDICEKWMLPKTTVSTILADFRKKGYVVFTSESNDKREKTITLTKEGEVFSASVLTKLHDLEERALEKMGSTLSLEMINGNVVYGDYFEQEVDND